MAEQYELTTPEAVRVSYEIAGIGTRFLSAIIDALAIIGLLVLVIAGALLIDARGGPWSTVAAVLALTLSFCVLWGYYMVYETVWDGQTPGKRGMDIRVIKETGYPIGFVDSVVRNLVRVIDFLPSLYGAGVVTMFISAESKRLGDYAAGTIVVKERPQIRLRDLLEAHPGSARTRSAASGPERGEQDPQELEWSLRSLSSGDLVLMLEYLDRASSLPETTRQRIADDIARNVSRTIGAGEPQDSSAFLERVYALCTEERNF